MMAYPPNNLYATKRASFNFISFDPDGPLGKMVVDWGDGKKTEIEEPVSGKNKVHHTYEDAGKYKVTATSYDTSGMENNFEKISFTVNVRKRPERPEPKKKKEHKEEPHHGGGGYGELVTSSSEAVMSLE